MMKNTSELSTVRHEFESFYYPNVLAEAQQWCLQDRSSAYIAGGQAVMTAIKRGDCAVKHWVDITGIAKLKTIGVSSALFSRPMVSMGAAVTLSELTASAAVSRLIPGFSAMLSTVANKAIRNQATLGGALACADPRSSITACCLALKAEMETSQRLIPMDQYLKGFHPTSLEHGELITAIRCPSYIPMAYVGIKHSSSQWPLLGVAIARHPKQVRVAVCGMGSQVYRDHYLERVLTESFSLRSLDDAHLDTHYMVSDAIAGLEERCHLLLEQCRLAVQALKTAQDYE